MDHIDLAISYFEKAYEDRDAMLITIKTWPNVPDNLKNDNRCQELIKRMGFPEQEQKRRHFCHLFITPKTNYFSGYSLQCPFQKNLCKMFSIFCRCKKITINVYTFCSGIRCCIYVNLIQRFA